MGCWRNLRSRVRLINYSQVRRIRRGKLLQKVVVVVGRRRMSCLDRGRAGGGRVKHRDLAPSMGKQLNSLCYGFPSKSMRSYELVLSVIHIHNPSPEHCHFARSGTLSWTEGKTTRSFRRRDARAEGYGLLTNRKDRTLKWISRFQGGRCFGRSI